MLNHHSLSLSFGLTFQDLYRRESLLRLHEIFQSYLKERDSSLYQRYESSSPTDTEILVELAPFLEDFLGELFNIKNEIHTLQQNHHALSSIHYVKRQFIQRWALRNYSLVDVESIDANELRSLLQKELNSTLTQLSLANKIQFWMLNEEIYKEVLTLAAQYCAWAILTEEGQVYHQQDVLFKVPRKLNPSKGPLHLIEIQQENNKIKGLQKHQRCRDGFSLTDAGFTRVEAMDQANYCIWCHHQAKDSCSKGLRPKTDVNTFMKVSSGVALTGCPLEQKISEMNEAKSQGYSVGALAIIIIDNPMVAATGHRICNDCTKACIYQKQDPVNIPGVETQILRDVLELPWGFEIYSLLTRWNPLNFQRPLPHEDTGYKVLVVGLGPAGFTLAHHLLNDGHCVIAIDGLKIEPLAPTLNGAAFQPINSLSQLEEPLDQRINGGFGGVAEYGITVRWNKNYLKIIRLLLERRSSFAMIGGVRFGGTLTIDQAINLGFDHIALCMGAGSPTLIPMKNGLALGVRQASDFLMALQLTGAAKKDSLANLQIRLPALVIGGGLTAIDTATEIMAYYPVQVEKFYKRYQELCRQTTEEELRQKWATEDLPIVDEFLRHGEEIVKERKNTPLGKAPNFKKLVEAWGGVTLVYRRDFSQSPSYTLNHEEVTKALEEGISILDNLTPLSIHLDENKHTCGLEVVNNQNQTSELLAARSILIAAGTKPNTNLRYDQPNLTITGQYFQTIQEDGTPIQPDRIAKPKETHVLMSSLHQNKFMSFFGDMHPSFSGNVVKAMASAKKGFPLISEVLRKTKPNQYKTEDFVSNITHDLKAEVVEVQRLTPTIIEVIVKAPQAARNFRPGQFFRLQNFESLAPTLNHTRLSMEGIALTGAKVDINQGTISLIVLEMGGGSNLCQFLKPGEPVVLMGPTGTPTHIPEKETVLLIGGGLGNAVLFSIGQAMKQKGCRVLYVAGYKSIKDRYKVQEIEAASDQILWCCDENPGFVPSRPQDISFVGNIVQGLTAYAQGQLPNPLIPLGQIDRLIVIGSDKMMAAVKNARETLLAPYFKTSLITLGSINSPMQCMMKEICAQCLQRHVDPITGKEHIVYSCVNQDQPLNHVDFDHLSQRLQQNRVQEILTKEWIQHICKK